MPSTPQAPSAGESAWQVYPLAEPPVSLAVERRDRLARVTLLGPGRGNAMGPELFKELPGVFAALDADDDVRAVVLTGSGRNFCYGLDLAAVAGSWGERLGVDGGLAGARSYLHGEIRRMQAALDAVAACRKPVAAAVSGWCIGGGVDLIAACDVRYAAADAKFSVREVKVAIVADLGSLQRLPALIGEGHLRELALTGRDIDAPHAARIGLVNDVLPTGADAQAAAVAFAEQVAANPPLVVQGVKQVLDAGLASRTAEGLRYVAAWNSAFLPSHDLNEALAAFAQHRPPSFHGR
jgi:enoyl-CoA hydratase